MLLYFIWTACCVCVVVLFWSVVFQSFTLMSFFWVYIFFSFFFLFSFFPSVSLSSLDPPPLPCLPLMPVWCHSPFADFAQYLLLFNCLLENVAKSSSCFDGKFICVVLPFSLTCLIWKFFLIWIVPRCKNLCCLTFNQQSYYSHWFWFEHYLHLPLMTNF